MLRYFIRRLLWACVLFIAVTLVTFMIFFVVPQDPARQACGQRATATCIERARHFLGLDKPVIVQYGRFLDRLVLHPSLGVRWGRASQSLRRPPLPPPPPPPPLPPPPPKDVTQRVLDAAPVTAS